MSLLNNPIQDYAWGPVDGVAALVGSPPTGRREAELWIGTHPRASSLQAEGAVAGEPLRGLAHLDFLLKVLAIEAPLSLQAHPSSEQAFAGYQREEAAGIPRDAPERTYPDPSAKPEMLVALVDTWALCGFRAVADARALVESLDDAALRPLVDALGQDEAASAFRAALAWTLQVSGADRAAAADALAAAASGRAATDPDDPWTWVTELTARYPGDPSAVAPLLLELLHLRPGDAVHLPAGNLHAYLRGGGIEIMAESDNVLRGGLTPKHVDVGELLRVVRFEPGVPPAPVPERRGALTVYDAGEADFALARIDPGSDAWDLQVTEDSLFLPVGGSATVTAGAGAWTAAPGQAVWMEPGGPVQVDSEVPVWWATRGGGLPSA
ncbi:MAG: mannose-6-phosphate isomerase, class I [Acidimicrobiales bacterium]|nr:mannose-6-phosphate isomerase, class I [Acidimicrobiales bacterium]